MKKIFITGLILSLLTIASAAPKRELRGVWLATVQKIDWPLTKADSLIYQDQLTADWPDITKSAKSQQSDLIAILDKYVALGINAVYFQVRPACDAFYASSYEPWSRWFTGTEGTAPNPYWDPLQYAIDACHQRGLELHAWVNPYRARVSGTSSNHATHVLNEHPSWGVSYGSSTLKVLNPGLPEVRTYVDNVVKDIVSRYDIDGIHIDDYFYPYPEANYSFNDQTAYNQYGNGMSLANWRRDNVNKMVEKIYNSIKGLKPWVKFSAAPFGIYKSGVPAGISGTGNYEDLYADILAWLNSGHVDYITPQLYWGYGNTNPNQDYAKLLPWWADQAGLKNRHMTSGLAAHNVATGTSGLSVSVLKQQVVDARNKSTCQGICFFSSKSITNNTSIYNMIKNELNTTKAIIPAATYLDNTAPVKPSNLVIANVTGGKKISWSKPSAASDGDYPRRYVVYGSTSPQVDINNAANILYMSNMSDNPTVEFTHNTTGTYYYAVTSLDRNCNESQPATETVNLYQRLWTRADITSNMPSWFSPDGNTERGIAYSDNHLYVVSRNGGTASVKVLDYFTGSDIKELSTTGISGGTFALNDVETDWDGNILACNLAAASTGENFIIYRWSNESATPAEWINYANPEKLRLGDHFTVHGSLSASAVIYAAAANSNKVLRWRVDNGVLIQTPEIITLSGVTNTGTTPSVAPYGTDTNEPFYVNGNSVSPYKFAYNGTAMGNMSSDVIPVSSTAIKGIVDGGDRYLAAFQNSSNMQNCQLVKINATSASDVTTGDIYGSTESLGDNINGNNTGDIAYRKTEGKGTLLIYVLSTNNGLGCYRPILISDPASSIDQNEKSLDLKLTNYPNPFNPTTTISFSLAHNQNVKLSVYDSQGRFVTELINGEKSAGNHAINLNGANLSSGVYFYKLETSLGKVVNKMIMQK